MGLDKDLHRSRQADMSCEKEPGPIRAVEVGSTKGQRVRSRIEVEVGHLHITRTR